MSELGVSRFRASWERRSPSHGTGSDGMVPFILMGLFLGSALSIVLLEGDFDMGLLQRELIVGVSVMLMLLAAMCVVRESRREPGALLTPLTFQCALFAGFYAFPALVALRGDAAYRTVTGLEANLPRIVGLAFLGFAGFVGGYLWRTSAETRGSSERRPILIAGKNGSFRFWLACFAIGWTGRIYLLLRGVYLQASSPEWTTPVEVSTFGGMILLLYLAIALASDGLSQARAAGESAWVRRWRWALASSLVTEYLFVIPRGSKGDLIFPVLLVVGPRLLSARGTSLLRGAVGVGALALAYTVIAPWTMAYREVTVELGLGSERRPSVDALWHSAKEATARYSERSDSQIEYDRAKTVARVSYTTMLNDVLDYLGRGGDKLWGRTYALAFVAPIPRVLWPGKPVISLGAYYNKLFTGTVTAAYAIGQLGELLINFGPVGIPLGMALFGAAYRVFWTYFKPGFCFERSLARALYVFFWHQVLIIGTADNFAGVVGGIVKLVVMLALVLTAIGVLRKPRPRWQGRLDLSDTETGAGRVRAPDRQAYLTAGEAAATTGATVGILPRSKQVVDAARRKRWDGSRH